MSSGEKIRTFIKENTHMYGLATGWGNGYVVIPKGHPFYGVDYDKINEYVEVHGGLTFGEWADTMLPYWKEVKNKDKGKYIIGFDTCHLNDNSANWTKTEVEKETERLKKQIESYARNTRS